MAGTASDYFRNVVLNYLLGGVALNPPASLAIGLWTSPLVAGSTGATAGEVALANGYARASVTRNQTNFPAAVNGLISNGPEITFPQASGSWGTITHAALLDSGVRGAGNIWWWWDLPTAKTIGSGDTPRFLSGDLDISAV